MILFHFIFSFVVAFASSKPHQHGLANLKVSSEDNEVEIELEIPAHDIIGFERQVKTKAQRKKLTDAMNQLSQAIKLVAINADADCTLKKFNIESDLYKPNKKHYEFEIELEYFCGNIAALKNLELNIFTEIKGIKKVDAKAATASGTFSQSLSASDTTFNLSK